jgi:acyl-CoA synthetase (AMP-forming)/AMP-acid ligase II
VGENILGTTECPTSGGCFAPAYLPTLIQILPKEGALGESHPPETQASAERRLMAFCRQRLAPFQVPVLIEITADTLHTERGKTIRSTNRMAA